MRWGPTVAGPGSGDGPSAPRRGSRGGSGPAGPSARESGRRAEGAVGAGPGRWMDSLGPAGLQDSKPPSKSGRGGGAPPTPSPSASVSRAGVGSPASGLVGGVASFARGAESRARGFGPVDWEKPRVFSVVFRQGRSVSKRRMRAVDSTAGFAGANSESPPGLLARELSHEQEGWTLRWPRG